jgi:hypothetical protein
MGAPYSLDLRKRVVAAIKGGMSRNQAAQQFGVAISNLDNVGGRFAACASLGGDTDEVCARTGGKAVQKATLVNLSKQ